MVAQGYAPEWNRYRPSGPNDKERPDVDLWKIVTEVIDMRSFSNLWYWIALAVVWSTASHFVIGVPFDLVLRAERGSDGAQADLRDLVRVNANRLLTISEVSGLWITGFASAILSALAVSGFMYRFEFSQAVFLLVLPLTLVGYLSTRTARRLSVPGLDDMDLRRGLRRHRVIVQGIGMLSILVTAMWGMYQNIVVGPLGG